MSLPANFFFLSNLFAQPSIPWDKTIGGSSDDRFYSLHQTSDEGYVLGGSSLSNAGGDKSEDSKGNNDYWVLKLDAAGNKVWDRTIGGIGDDELT